MRWTAPCGPSTHGLPRLEMAGVATRPQMAVWLNAHPEVLKRNGVPVVAGQSVRQFVGPKPDWKEAFWGRGRCDKRGRSTVMFRQACTYERNREFLDFCGLVDSSCSFRG